MNSLKVIVAGSRTFSNTHFLEYVLDFKRNLFFDFKELVHGGAKGADTLAMLWAEKNEIPVRCFPADWDKYGKQAGFIRNKQMAEYADVLIAFWDGKSRGTKIMIELAAKANITSIVITYDGNHVVDYKTNLNTQAQ